MADAAARAISICISPPTCKYICSLPHARRDLPQLNQISPRFLPSFTVGTRSFKPVLKASVGSVEYVVEPATDVKFQAEVSLPGCSDPLDLLGTGYREKVFAIIGVKVYAAGLYVNKSVAGVLNAWRGKSTSQIKEDATIFSSVYDSSSEKSLQIVLVRDVDGKTFWNALDEAIAPRIKEPTPVDETALSTFRNTFQSRPLKKGTFIFLTWVDSSNMLISISSDGLPISIDATIESLSVASALFDVFFGATPVSPTLKASVANGLAKLACVN